MSGPEERAADTSVDEQVPVTLDGLGIQVTELDFKGDTIVAPWPLPESPPELPPLLSSEPAAA